MAGRKPKISYTEKGRTLLEVIGLGGVQQWEVLGRPIEGTLTSRALTSLGLIMAEHDPQSRFSPGAYYRVFIRTGRICPSDVKPCMADVGLATGHSNLALMVRVLHQWAHILDGLADSESANAAVADTVLSAAETLREVIRERGVSTVSMLSQMQSAVEAGDVTKQRRLAKAWAQSYMKVKGGKLYDRCTDKPVRQDAATGLVPILGVGFPLAWVLRYVKRGVEYGAL